MVSVYSLLGVVALLAVAHFSGKALLPAKTRKVDQLVFIWLVGCEASNCIASPADRLIAQVFDALIHLYALTRHERRSLGSGILIPLPPV